MVLLVLELSNDYVSDEKYQIKELSKQEFGLRLIRSIPEDYSDYSW